MKPASIFSLCFLLLILSGCGGGGEELTSSAIAKAKAVWKKAKIRDYNLTWSTSGARVNHYTVYVREGVVKRIDSKLPDGRVIEAHPAESRMYSVDGLFRTLQEELDQVQADRPFGQPKGTAAVLRFSPDPKLGYPKSYQRDVAGTNKGLGIEVDQLVPTTSNAPIPELKTR